MIYKQIGEIVEDVFHDLLGQAELTVAEDLSNIVEVGKVITGSVDFSDKLDNYVRSIIDRVGKVVFRDNKVAISHLPIFKDSWEYGSICEKIRVEAPPTQEIDYTFDLANYTGEDVFKPVLPTASAKFFNNSTTFALKITLPKRQVKSAFTSASEMSRFISLIENSIKQKLAIDLLALEYRTEANLIVEKFKYGNNHSLVNLYQEWLTDDPLASGVVSNFHSCKDAITNPYFLRYANMRIGMYRDFIKKPSVLYADSNGAFYNTTSDSEQTMLLLTDFDKALDTYLYSMNRHNDFVKLSGYSSVPYWMSGGESDSYEKRSAINAIPASEGSADAEDRQAYKLTNIIGLLHDERASAVMCEHRDTESINVPDARAINYWYFADANYVNDTEENAIVFFLSDYYCVGRFGTTPPDDFTDNYADYYTWTKPEDGLIDDAMDAFADATWTATDNAPVVLWKKLSITYAP